MPFDPNTGKVVTMPLRPEPPTETSIQPPGTGPGDTKAKPFWESKTFWANFLLLALDVVQGQYGIVPGLDPGVVTKVTIAANLGLRFLTSTPVRVK